MTPAPTPSWRKPAGALLILALTALWAALVVTLIQRLEPLPRLFELLVYPLAGIAWLWLLPMRRLLAWMETDRPRVDGNIDLD